MEAANRTLGRLKQNNKASSPLLRALGAVVLLLGASVSVWAEGGDNPRADVIVAATPGRFPPQYAVDEAGNATGFAVEVMDEVARLANLRVIYRILDNWQAVHDELLAGRVDVVPNMGITPARAALWDVTDPVETFSISLFIRPSSDFARGLPDLAGRKIGVQRTNVARQLLEDGTHSEVMLFDTEEQALFELLAGHVDAIAGPLPVVLKLAREVGVGDRIQPVGEPLAEIKRGIAVSRDRPALRERLNRAVSEFVHSPAYQRIYAQWYGRPAPFWTISRVIWAMGALLALSLVTMGGWRQYSVLRLNRDLRESEAALAKAQALAHVGNWRWSIERDELIAGSDEYARIHGVGPDQIHDLMKRQMECVVHPEDRERYAEFSRKVDEEGLDYDIAYRIVRPDGEIRHVLEIGEVVCGAAGRPVEHVGTLQDITERKQAEQALKDSLAHLRHAQKIAKLDYWVWDAQTNRIAIPGGGSSVIGAPEADLCGLSDEVCIERYVHPDDRERVRDAYGPPSARNPAIDVEYRLVRPDGEVRIVHEVGESVFGENGEIASQFGTIQDVTEQRATDARFRRYFELPLVGSAIYAPDKRWIRVNDKLCELFGFSREELLRLTWADLTHPDDLAENLRLFDETLSGRRNGYSMDKRFVRKNGEILYSTISVHCVRQPSGAADYFIVLVRDITERKQAEQALKESLAHLRHAQRIAKLDYWVWHPKKNRVTVAGGEASVIGASFDELYGLADEVSVQHYVHPEDRERVLRAYGPPPARNPTIDVEYRLIRPDGEVRVIHEIGEPVFGEDGQMVSQFGTFQDITEQKQTEQVLRESLAHLRHAQKIAKLDYWVWDAREDKITVAVDRPTMLGIPPEEVLGLSDDAYVERLVHPGDRERVLEAYGPPSEKKPNIDVEYRVIRPDGEVRFVHEVGEPMFDHEGEMIAQVGTLQDITERKQAEEEILKLNAELEQRVEARTAELHAAQDQLLRNERLAALGQLTGTVSHELRNPLGAMQTAMSTIRKLVCEDDPMLKRSVELVDRSILRCDSIIGELLDYSRVRKLAPEPTVLDDWLQGLLDEYQVPTGIELRRDLRAGAVAAIDQDRLRRVVVNLLDNACQAMTQDHDGATGDLDRLLSVATRQADGRVEISISDTGPGIPAERADKIFEPLYSTKAFGVGLGLPIVKQILEQHDGGVEVDHTVERGTRMVVWLPQLIPLQKVAS